MKPNEHPRQAWWQKVPHLRLAKRIVIAIIGGTVTFIGVALLVLPGPAFVVLPIGLSILATEFVWARRWLRKAREMVLPDTSKTPPSER